MLNNRIKELRVKMELTQREFGDKSGVGRDVIANIECGRVAPKSLFLCHLCDTFHVNPSWLETGKGNMLITRSRNLDDAIKLFEDLGEDLQEFALLQLRGLLELQNKQQATAKEVEGRE